MRNAATFDDDLVTKAPPRAGAPRKPRAGGAKGKKSARQPRFDMHRVARFTAIGMAATMALGIMVNALVLQKGHHPAPLFGKATAVSPTPLAAQSTAPLPPTHAVEASAAAPKAARRPIVATHDDDAPGSDDAISRLLAGGPGSGAKAAARSDAKKDDKGTGKMVTGVQRALTKLGFKVPATGAAGPATKKAIEAFQKDRHMPVKGEVDRRLVKVLAAESGIKID